jgi:hypothetical protein
MPKKALIPKSYLEIGMPKYFRGRSPSLQLSIFAILLCPFFLGCEASILYVIFYIEEWEERNQEWLIHLGGAKETVLADLHGCRDMPRGLTKGVVEYY